MNGGIEKTHTYRWNTGTLSWVPWDGSLATGDLNIGTVDQGTAGVDPWLVEFNSAQHVVVDNSVAVTGPLTDAQLRASAIPVSGTFFQATQPVSGTVDVSNLPSDQLVHDANIDVALSTRTKPSDQQHVIIDSSASLAVMGPLTDTQLRAVAVPISGSVTANAGSNLNTSLLALEAGGNLDAIKAAVQIIDNFISGSRGLVTEDNSAAIKTAVETLDNFISGARGLVTEDNSAAIKADADTLVTNTNPLVTAAAGGYVRQDSTATIAKESGGNLDTLVAKDFATQTTLELIESNTEPLITEQGIDAADLTGPMVQAVGDDGSSLLPSIVSPLRLDYLGRLSVTGEAEDVPWVKPDIISFFDNNADSQFFDLSW